MGKSYEYTPSGARKIDPVYLIANDKHPGLLDASEIKKRSQIESWVSAKTRFEEQMSEHIAHYNEDGGPVDLTLIVNDVDKHSKRAMNFAMKIADIVLGYVDNATVHYINERDARN